MTNIFSKEFDFESADFYHKKIRDTVVNKYCVIQGPKSSLFIFVIINFPQNTRTFCAGLVGSCRGVFIVALPSLSTISFI